MLEGLSLLSVWLVSSLVISFSFSFSILIIAVCLGCWVVSGYVGLLGSTFVGIWSSLDSLGVILICLSLWIVAMMLLVSVKYTYNSTFPSAFVTVVALLAMIVVVFFYTDSTFLLYVMFEASLLPTLYLILKWGYQPERLQAGVYFVMYTVCGSLPLLFMILYMGKSTASFFMHALYPFVKLESSFNSYILYFALMFAFLVKVPMWGVHLWLPKAHVEAPVSGSMILAGILLKLGGYGLLKFFLLQNLASSKVVMFMLGVNLWGILAVSFICLSSTDMKGMIAYSSIIHMGMMVVGILSGTIVGYLGAYIMMVAHGFNSSGLFSLVNFNYEGVGSRNICMQKGFSCLHPVSSLFWFVLLSCNMAAPPSLNLVSEILVLVSMIKLGGMLFVVAGLASFMSASYNLYLFSSQQGECVSFFNFSSSMSSSFMLSTLMHGLPILLLVLCLFIFKF